MYWEFIALIVGLLIGWLSVGHKSQAIRLVDILVYGPILIIIGFYLENLSSSRLTSLILIFMGAGTMTYNLKNYLHQTNQ